MQVFFCSFALMQKNQKIKAKNNGLPHGRSKRLSFMAGSAFFESKRSAKASRPALNLNLLARPLGWRRSRFWPRLTHPSQSGFVVLKKQVATPLGWAGRNGRQPGKRRPKGGLKA